MNDDSDNKHKLKITLPEISARGKNKVSLLPQDSKPLRQQIKKGVEREKIKTSESRFVKYLQPILFKLLNVSANFLEWLFLHLVYLITFLVTYHGIKLLKISNPRIRDIITNFVSYGWMIIWLIIFFVTFFYHALFSIFYLNSNKFFKINFSYIFTYHTLNQLSFALAYGLLIAGALTIIANGYSLFIFRQSFGQIFMKRKLFDKKSKKQVSRARIIMYMFVNLLVCATFFVWPLFLIIVLLSLIYYGFFQRSWIKDLLLIKTVESTTTKKSGLLTRFLELFTFYYTRKAEFSLSEVTKTTKTDNTKNSEMQTSKNKSNTAEQALNESVNTNNIPPIIPAKVTASSSSSNAVALSAASPTIFSTSKIKSRLSGHKITYSSTIAQFVNFWIYLITFFFSFSSFGIWAALRRAHIVGGFFKLFFFRITSPSFTIIFNNQILSRLYLFRDEQGNITNTLNGWNTALTFSKDNINYLINFIPHASSWHDIWNNIEFIVAFLVINFKYNPAITAAWLLLFFVAIWFFLNVAFIVLFGNTFVGFCLSPRKVRLIHSKSMLSVSMLERLIYCFFYVTFAFLYIVPIVNIIWIAANIGCFLYYRESLLNRIAGFKYGTPKNNFKFDLLQTVETTNYMLLWIKTKFYKELFAKDRI